MRKILFFFTFLILGSCHNTYDSSPENLISEDKMADILLELMIINSVNGGNKKILEKHINQPIKYVFDKHKVDSTQFEISNNYYSRNIDIYNSIYDRVFENLEVLEKSTQKQIEIDKIKTDSIKKLKKININNSKENRFFSRKKSPVKRYDKLD